MRCAGGGYPSPGAGPVALGIQVEAPEAARKAYPLMSARPFQQIKIEAKLANACTGRCKVESKHLKRPLALQSPLCCYHRPGKSLAAATKPLVGLQISRGRKCAACSQLWAPRIRGTTFTRGDSAANGCKTAAATTGSAVPGGQSVGGNAPAACRVSTEIRHLQVERIRPCSQAVVIAYKVVNGQPLSRVVSVRHPPGYLAT